ncbi:mannonate dehydratase [Sphingobacterium sp. SG20118]|uniref:mannonate dehydratase n=1 Tax=Sphingobacterium sp. SG20118 TaxID=3367156 RepID=UPI0037DFC149
MRKLEQTWRWYGPNDPVSLEDIKQAGATGIVTALHHLPHGAIWPVEDILERKNIIEEAGLVWSVVESLPVHEAIKTRAENAEYYIGNYIKSLENLAQCGVKIITYNFMPVLDWTRTQLDLVLKNGAKALYFDWIDLAVFDIYILKREHAKKDYSNAVLDMADEKFTSYTQMELDALAKIVLMGIPGEHDISLQDLNNSIVVYSKIGRTGLLENLLYFLNSIASVCERDGIKMSIHPDDPPYAILGLPRIVSNLIDLEAILAGVNMPFNGICFCTGSLGASQSNDVVTLLGKVKTRVYFSHLRNVRKDKLGSFYEADHLDGDVNMFAIMKILTEENQKRDKPIPFRPDHGHQMLDDLNKTTNPGYSAIGRLRGLAELRGLEYGILGE